MTNTEKQVKNCEDMNNEEKAQAIYNTLLQEQPTTLSELLLELSAEYNEDEILTVDEWLEYLREDPSNLETLAMIAQMSKDLNIDDVYIRESIYYYGYSDNVLDLVDKDEAIEWIARALGDDCSYIKDLEELDVELCKD